ncbi:Hypothetical protein NocV09_02401100 [Nannochloropsis oceanica]
MPSRRPPPYLYSAVPLLFLVAFILPKLHAFLPVSPYSTYTSTSFSSTALQAKKPSTKKSSGTGASTVKGFGSAKPSASSSSSSTVQHPLLKDKGHLALIDWIQTQGGLINHLAVASIQPYNIRGIVALKPFKKGDIIISIPYSLALDVTPPSLPSSSSTLADPIPAALELLRQLDDEEIKARYAPYLAMIPSATTKQGEGGYGLTTDFFTKSELESLQWPPTLVETNNRIQRTQEAAKEGGREEGLVRWAVWMVVSRSLGIAPALLGEGEGGRGGGRSGQRQVLIPFLDLCNHDEGSPHVLTGREGGMLKVVAGREVGVGEEVAFAYGGGQLTSDRFVQDYGFLEEKGGEGGGNGGRDWDRRMVRGMIKAGRREEVERFVAGFREEEEEEKEEKEGWKEDVGERAKMARRFARRMRAACVAELAK